MNTKLQIIKSKVKALYDINPNIHVSLSVNYSRAHLKKIKAVITGIYPNIFTAEVNVSGVKEHYNFQYVDILTGALEIAEMKLE